MEGARSQERERKMKWSERGGWMSSVAHQEEASPAKALKKVETSEASKEPVQPDAQETRASDPY